MVTQNQSLRAFIVRATGSSVPEVLVTALTVLVVVAGLFAVWRQSRAGADLAAVVGLAAVGLVLAPISWTHHWVWVVPGLILLAGAGKWVAAWGVGTVFFVAPMWFVASGRGGAPLATPELVLASAYLWVGLLTIVYLLFAPPLVLPSPPSRTASDGTSLTGPPRQRV
jgi:alpha-1,2-mannosyltransferase